jgi:tungstate transport system permease protein
MGAVFDDFLEGLSLLFSFNSELYEIMFLSLYVSGMATLLATVIGIPVGSSIALKKFRGRELLRNVTYTMMGLPSVVAGLIIFFLLSRDAPLGFLGLLYTPFAIILAQFILAVPVVAGISISAVSSVPTEIQDAASSLGADDWQCTTAILKEAKTGLVTAIITGFSTCISEVGAAMMVGGNIRFETQVLSTATVTESGQGNWGFAFALGMILLILVFLINLPLLRLQRKNIDFAKRAVKK